MADDTTTKPPPPPPPEGGGGSAGNLIPVNIEDEMRQSYLDYSMSRHHRARAARRARRPQAGAPPHPVRDARPGELPQPRVQEVRARGRRRASASTTRTATPAVYDAHGAPGAAVDPALPAGRRAGQLRLGRRRFAGRHALHRSAAWTRLAEELLADIDKETVDFGPNYDDSTDRAAGPARARSPTCWSTARTGIAVGMATNIPPHNMGEVIDAHAAPHRQPEGHRRGPDAVHPRARTSPPPASSRAARASASAYETGRGHITLRARTEIEVAQEDRAREHHRHRDSRTR